MSGKGSMREKLALELRKAQALGSGATDGAEASCLSNKQNMNAENSAAPVQRSRIACIFHFHAQSHCQACRFCCEF